MRILVAMLIVAYSTLAVSTNLPVEHESVRLLLAAEKSISNSSWSNAKKQLSDLEKLDVELPAKYYFFKGIVLKQSGLVGEAQQNLETYVVKSGAEGDYYTQALELITELEADAGQVEATKKKDDVPEIAPSGDGYIKSLQALFLTEDPIKALTLQVNSLLSAHPYTGTRIKKQKNETGIEYTISVSGQNIIVQEKRFNNGQPSLKVNKFNVLGIDPFLRYGCEYDQQACWIYDPVKQYERWLIIDRDELVAQELSKALSKLMIALQQ